MVKKIKLLTAGFASQATNDSASCAIATAIL